MKGAFNLKSENGSVELIVIGLLTALIIVLAIPLLKDIGEETENNLQEVRDEMIVIREDHENDKRSHDR